ncbi:polyprenyl synthetase family protein [bacterium]|nr:polyprenyl synthetase family protein [bacterium]
MHTVTPAALNRAKLLVEPALRAAVDSLDENLRLPVTYHLGWTDQDGNPSDAGSGKGVRSALAMLGTEAVHGLPDAAISGGVAVELIHNFSLIHDDIMDNDRTRRHRATVWDVFGVGEGIVVGDAMHALAFEVLLDDDRTPHGAAATQRLVKATSAMIAGQAQDVALDRGDTATLDECIAMEANKTGALLAQSTAIGAVLGGGSDAQVGALEHFGMTLGIAFQAVDDVLGIWGDAAATGKPVGNDLREQKKSMPIAIAFDRGGTIGDAVRAAFTEPMNDQQIQSLAAQLESAGIRDQVQTIARDYLDQAIATLDTVELAPAAKAELIELANFIWERDN